MPYKGILQKFLVTIKSIENLLDNNHLNRKYKRQCYSNKIFFSIPHNFINLSD